MTCAVRSMVMDTSYFNRLIAVFSRSKPVEADNFAGLNIEELRELRRVREDALLARELAKNHVVHLRTGLM